MMRSILALTRLHLGCRLLAIGIVLTHGVNRAWPQPIEAKAVTAEELLSVRTMYWVYLSPDGSVVAYLIGEPPKGDRDTEHKTLWVVKVAGGDAPRQVAAKQRELQSPAWSPTGQQLAFLAEGASPAKKAQLWLLSPLEGEPRQVTAEAEGVVKFHWCPGGKHIAFTTPVARGKDNGDPVVVGEVHRNSVLCLVDIDTGRVDRITDGEFHVQHFDLSPDGSRFAIGMTASSHLDDLFAHQSLALVDRKNGKVTRRLSANFTGDMGPLWSPDGKWIVFSEFTPKRMTYHLAVIPAEGGTVSHPLGVDYRGTPYHQMRWDADSRHLWVLSVEGSRNHLLKAGIEGTAFERMDVGGQHFWSFDLSADGKTIVLVSHDERCPGDVVVVRRGKGVHRLTEVNPKVPDWSLGGVREIHWKNPNDGRDVNGVLVTPAGFVKGSPRPTVVLLHGGPFGFWWGGWLGIPSTWIQYLASHGYVVFLPNPRGSMGGGVDYAEAIFQDWGGQDVQDILSGVDHLVAQGIADPRRLGVGGWSHGGYLTAAVTTQTDRFRAAIVGAGIVDLLSNNLTNDIATFYRAHAGGDEITHRKQFERMSPLTNIAKCKTPTLVLHGENDRRVSADQGRMWYRGLQLLGVETEMVIYPRDAHAIRERRHQIDHQERVLAWFDRHLKGQ